MTVVNRVGDDLHTAAEHAGIRILRVAPHQHGHTLTVASRRDVYRLRWASRLRCRTMPGQPWAVIRPDFDVIEQSLISWHGYVPQAVVTPVPDGVDPWLHRGPTWDVTVRHRDTHRVVAALRGAR